MELLTEFKKYTGYFHDGDIIDVYQNKNQIVFWMESAQIPPDDIKNDFVLTNLSTLRGRLHIEGVKLIFKYDQEIQKIDKQYDFGDIFDFNIHDKTVTLLVTWKKTLSRSSLEQTDMIKYSIQAESIFWENLPTTNNPTFEPIENYQKYFQFGQIYEMQQEDIGEEVVLSIESLEIPSEASQLFALTKADTLKGDLLLTWPKNIKINGYLCDQIPKIQGNGKILKITIGFHFIKLEIQWNNVTNEFISEPKTMTMEMTFGAIDIRPSS